MQTEQEFRLQQRNHHVEVVRLSAEYVRDFNLELAAARANVSLDDAKAMYKSHHFAVALQEQMEWADPEDIMPRGELLMRLKLEAVSPYNQGATRVRALQELAKLLGYDQNPGREGPVMPAPPSITINLTSKDVIET